MEESAGEYSCETAAQTLEWIQAIIGFIQPYTFLMEAHVVNFFKDRLWEAVDQEWMECLTAESVENLLLIPSGVVQDHWPASLKEFIHTLKSLSLPRDQVDLQKAAHTVDHTYLVFLCFIAQTNCNRASNDLIDEHSSLFNDGCSQVEVLSAVVSFITNSVGAQTIIDVGAGQGYLAQVLSFHYQHPVIAIDASSHHGRVTDARAERIKKHYSAQMRKSGSAHTSLNIPKAVTCEVSSIDMLKALSKMPSFNDEEQKMASNKKDGIRSESLSDTDDEASLVLAGLHACGDLSVTMLKTFIELDNVKAVVSIGCCYNLLSQGGSTDASSRGGFPMSSGIKSAGLSLGKCSRDLACQSSERWRGLKEDSGLHNFDLHAFRAAFQMVLWSYYPEVLTTSPSIGRQGKAMRRQQQNKILESSFSQKSNGGFGSKLDTAGSCSNKSMVYERASSETNYRNFEKYTSSGLQRLGLPALPDMDVHGIWKANEPFMGLIGPYWSLRAAIGGVLETLILLDRLLFLQEQGIPLKASMVPIFAPSLSPRNVAIIAVKT